MTNRNYIIGVTVNADGAKQGAQAAADAVRDMGDKMEQHGARGAEGLKRPGEGAKQSADKVESATKSIIQSIERATAAMKAGAKGGAEYYEVLGQQRGINPDILNPYISKLREAEKAQQELASGNNSLAMSAKQTAAAMRGVPAQFTDIIVSLQGGQAPMTVLLQQGGQLKDMFGGIGVAAKAIGGYILGLINPVTIAVGAIGAIGAAFYQGHKEAENYTKAIITSGNAAGASVPQLTAMAEAIAKTTGVTKSAAAEALAQITANGNIAMGELSSVATTAVRLQREAGIAIGDTIKAFADLAKDPVRASAKLNEETRFLTLSIYEQVKALDAQGKTAEAASIAMNSYADVMSGRAIALKDNLGYIERAWRGITGAASGAWDAMLNVGRDVDPVTAIKRALGDAEAKLADIEKNRAYNPMMADAEAITQRATVEALREKVRELNRATSAQRLQTEAEAAGIRTQEAGIKASDELAKSREKFATKQEQLNKALADYAAQLGRVYQANPSSAALDPKKITQDLLAIKNSFAETSRSIKSSAIKPDAWLTDVAKSYSKSMEDLAKVQGAAAASADELSKSQTELKKAMSAPEFAAYSRQQQEQLIYAASLAQAEEDRAARKKLEAQQAKEAGKAYEDAFSAQAKYAESLAADVVKQLESNEAIGLTTEQLGALEAAKLRDNAASKDRLATIADEIDTTKALGAAYRAQAVELRKLADAKEHGAAKKASIEALEDWKKTADGINQSITDALMRGFESGKDFAQNLRDTIANMFRTMVLRPVISAIVNPVSMALTGAMGLSGTASAGQSALSTASGLGNAAGLLGAGGIGGSLAAGAGWLTGATTLGGSLSAGMSLMGTGTAAGAASGLGMIAGALGPIMIGVALLASLVKKSTPHLGAGATYSAATGLTTGADQYTKANYGFGAASEYDATAAALTGNLATTVVRILDSTATNFGKQAGYSAATAFADDSSKDGAWGSLRIQQGGATVLDWQATSTGNVPKEFSDGEVGSKEYLAAIAASAREALNSIDLPGWAKDTLAALGDAPTLEGLVTAVDQINAGQAALETLGNTVSGFANLSDSASTALVRAFGSVENLVASTSSYYQQFYSEAERTDILTRQTTEALAALGQTMPATRDEFRAMVDAQLAAGDSGAENAAALIKLSGALDQILPQFEDFQTAVADTAQQLYTSAAQLSDQQAAIRADTALAAYESLQSQLASLRSQATTQYLDAQRAVTAAQEHLAGVLKDTLQGFRGFLDELDSTSAAPPLQRLDAQRASFEALGQRALAGDTAAAGQLQGSAKTLLDLSKSYSASYADYRRDEAGVRIVIGKMADLANAALGKLPEQMQAVADPVQDAYASLAAAVKAEIQARQEAIGMGASLSESTQDLVTQYRAAARAMDHLQSATLATDVAGTLETALNTALDVDYEALLTQELEKYIPDMGDDFIPEDIFSDRIDTAVPDMGADFLPEDIFSEYLQSAIPSMGEAFDMRAMAQQTIQNAINGIVAGVQVSTPAAPAPTPAAPVVTTPATAATPTPTVPSVAPTVGTATPDYAALLSGLPADVLGWMNAHGSLQPDYLRAISNFAGASGGLTSGGDYVRITPEQIDLWAKGHGVPAFDTGINRVPRDMLAQIHEGEAVVPAAYNPFNPGAQTWGQGDRAMQALADEVKALRAEVASLRTEQRDGHAQIAANTGKTARLTQRFEDIGMPPTRT